MRVKLLGSAVTLSTTADNISNAKEVLVVHDAGGNTSRILTLTAADGTTVVASMTINPGFQLVIRKNPDQKLKVDTGSDVVATPVSYIS
jgi:hypothetical protein